MSGIVRAPASPPEYHLGMQTGTIDSVPQIAIRLPREVLAAIDQLVADGQCPSRAEAVRSGVEMLLREAERKRIDAEIVEGYKRIPDEENDPWAEASLRQMIEEEPW